MALGVVHFAVLAFTQRWNSHLNLFYLAAAFLEALTYSRVSGGISRYLCWFQTLPVSDDEWRSLLSLWLISRLCWCLEVRWMHMHRIKYSLGRGDSEPDLSIWPFRDQQIPVNSPACDTGMVLERHVPAQSARPAGCIDVHGSGRALSCSVELS